MGRTLKRRIIVLLPLVLIAFAIHQFLFWTTPGYELDRLEFQLHWRCNAGLSHDEKEKVAIYFNHHTTDQTLQTASELLSGVPVIHRIHIPIHCQITSAGFASLTQLKGVMELLIDDNILDAASFNNIAKIPSLRVLRFQDIVITTEMLLELKGATALETLYISCHKNGICGTIDSEGLERICSIPSLKKLVLIGMDVNEAAKDNVVTARPDLELTIAN